MAGQSVPQQETNNLDRPQAADKKAGEVGGPQTNKKEGTDKELVKRLYIYTRPYLAYWFVAIVCTIMASGLTSLQAYLIKPALDEIFIEKNLLYFKYLPWVIFIVFFLKGVAYFFYEYFMEFVGQSMIRDLRMDVFKHMHRQSLTFFRQNSTGGLMSRILTDVGLIQGGVTTATVGVVKNVVQFLGLVGLIFYLDWQLAVFCTAFILIAFLPVVFFGRIHRRLNTQLQIIAGKLSTTIHESLAGNMIIQAFSMHEFEVKRFSGILNESFNTKITDTRVAKISHSVMELLGGIGIISIIVYGGGRVVAGEATTGTFFSFLTALIMAYEPIKGLARINNTIQQGLSAAKRVFWLLDYEPEIQDKPNAVVLPPFHDEIRFNQVGFQYPSSESPVLHDIDLTLKKGQRIAIVGPSGSGKTTLANILPRFLEVTQGSVTIDGHDITQVTTRSLRDQIAVVTQNTVLFNDTVRNNIVYGRTDCSMEQIMEAARQANALEYIQGLPQGFDTQIGESGARLSGGQRQRLAVARAFMKNAPILILDEATSSLDTVSERAVQDAIDHLVTGRTVIIIAHRLSTVERADRIVLIKGGRIAESGTHAELLNREDSEYRKLYQLQRSTPAGDAVADASFLF